MAIPRVVLIATSICLLLLLIIQSLYLVYSEDPFGQTSFRWPLSNAKHGGLKSLDIGDEYLLGVGKADITGYVQS
jgi:hypothetical protein